MFFANLKKFINLMKNEQNGKRKRNRFSFVVNEEKYLNSEKVWKLRKYLKNAKETALKKNKTIPVRDWFMVELGLFTGLRVNEMVHLKGSDLYLLSEQSFLIVRKGKGDKPRTVYFPKAFKNKYLFYLRWKKKIFPQGDYLFVNKRGEQLTKRALQKSFKKCLQKAGLDSHYSIHCLRHTYGSFLYKSSNHNLRLVQEQLGHSSIRTTQVYTSLMNEEVKKAVEKLYRTK